MPSTPSAAPASILTQPPAAWRDATIDITVAALDGTPDEMALAVYTPPDRMRRLDPRQPDPDLAHARIDHLPAAETFGRLWGDALAAAGVRVAILSGWGALPPWAWPTILDSLRTHATGVMLVADADGLADPADLRGVDAILAPMRGWNGRDSAFLRRLRQIRATAPVVVRNTGHAREAAFARALALPDIDVFHPSETDPAVPEVSHILSAPGADVLVTLLSEGDPRFAAQATLVLINTHDDAPASVDPAGFLPAVRGLFAPFAGLVPGRTVTLEPAAQLLATAPRLPDRPRPALSVPAATQAAEVARVAIENVTPSVDDGAFPAKRVAGDVVTVEADLICDGHDKLAGAVQWRGPEGTELHEVAMRPLGNDRWQASFPVETLGLYEFRVLAWRDAYETFRDEIAKKHAAGVPIALEIREGTEQIVAARARHQGDELDWPLTSPLYRMDGADEATRLEVLLSAEVADAMRRADLRAGIGASGLYRIDAERTGAAFASWYEVFPRSMSDNATRHGTFADVERHLPRVAAMGFDVLYFPPVHPIGLTNRKGRNNTLTPGESDPGSPYAIGTADGGHDALHPELGTLEDFLHLREAAAAHGLELALDFAIQCSPDHPWLREHRDWFAWRPDGSIRYAENPPKKYQDIVNVDFYAEGAIPDLWIALANVVLFWAENGIRLFRVDNPHTKPFPFWQWLIAEVRARYPDAVFLAEAFTRPKVMNRLAKIGFSQSYTYFTWRNTRPELEEYLTQLTTGPEAQFFRPHFFVNTPDINPTFLQTGGRPAHLIRAALAATLSGLWGVYNGFELCEATPLAPGKEEYLDSEKFELRAWDWDRAGNIVAEITRLNHLRLANPALRRTTGLAFLPSGNASVIAYEKATDSRDNVVCCFVSLDPFGIQDTRIELPLWKSGLPGEAHVEIEDLMSGARFGLDGAWHDLRLSPELPFILWRLIF